MSRPIVVIPSCTKTIDDYVFDTVSRRYSAAIAQAADCQPLLIPLDEALIDIGAVLDVADGIFLSGSPSNIAPHHYSEEHPVLPDALDHARDTLTLPLIRAVVERRMPLFAVCRGVQELNVALGGTLHQAVHDEQDYDDHRARNELPMEERWGPRHPISLTGKLREWVGQDEIMVNSLHGQGLKRIAGLLKAEAFAKDGLVEAVQGPEDHPFLLGVQWHPEWKATTNPASMALFKRFGAAARESGK
ncbi:MAG: gamma-glutamyl-gamma-aminobutyrate hydrolase family protein [Hyphomicrobium sp.]